MKKGSSILLLIIGYLFIRHFIYNGGDIEHVGLIDALYGFLLIGTIIIILIISIGKFMYSKKEEKFNYLPFVTTAIIIIVGISISYIQNSPLFNSPVVLRAYYIYDSAPSGGIELKADHKFVAHRRYVEATSQFVGLYNITNDTLHIQRNLCKETDSILYNNYLITKNWLYPIKNGKADTMDKRLEIQRNK